MVDFRVDTDYLDHPKTVKLVKLLGWPGVICHLRLLGFATKYRPKGVLTKMTREDIAIAAKWKKDPDRFVDALLEVGYLDRVNRSTVAIHDWKDWNPWVFESPERRERARKGGQGKAKKGAEGKPSKPKTHSNDNDLRPTPSPSFPKPTSSVYEDLRLLFNQHCPSLPTCNTINDSRRRAINARMKPRRNRREATFWIDFFKRVEASDWLTARASSSDGWTADFDWILKPKWFDRITEGVYDNKTRRGKKTKAPPESFGKSGETSI